MKKQKQIDMTLWIKSMAVCAGGLNGLAKSIGMSDSTIFARCRSPEKWRLDELCAIRAACGVSREDFMRGLAKFI